MAGSSRKRNYKLHEVVALVEDDNDVASADICLMPPDDNENSDGDSDDDDYHKISVTYQGVYWLLTLKPQW